MSLATNVTRLTIFYYKPSTNDKSKEMSRRVVNDANGSALWVRQLVGTAG
jgi:hypothetical protein